MTLELTMQVNVHVFFFGNGSWVSDTKTDLTKRCLAVCRAWMICFPIAYCNTQARSPQDCFATENVN